MPASRLPLALFSLANPKLDHEQVNLRARELSTELSTPCPQHLDSFLKAFVAKFGRSADDLVAAIPVLRAIGRKAKLGIFKAECMHADVRESGAERMPYSSMPSL